ncbi:hypothetical protein ACLN6N_02570 [Sphingomonas carotinifaciens]|uniref:hypothetical protein n=1 Tax=Sphingomonas carotinifaciens TaxID=1166323 RepID=UPI0039A2C965
MNALVQFQQACEAGLIPVQSGRLDASVLMAADQPNGKPRFSYMRVDGLLVTAIVMFAQNGMEGDVGRLRHPLGGQHLLDGREIVRRLFDQVLHALILTLHLASAGGMLVASPLIEGVGAARPAFIFAAVAITILGAFLLTVLGLSERTTPEAA